MSLNDDEQQARARNSAAFNALFGDEGSNESSDAQGTGHGHSSGSVNVPDAMLGEITAEGDVALDDANADSNGAGAGVDEDNSGATARGRTRVMRLVSPGTLVVNLLKGYIDREDNKVLFESLVRQELEVSTLCRTLFLRLVIDHEAGFAYVRSLSDEEMPSDAGQRPPRLLSRKPLPFYDSLILILLRQRLLDFDMSGQFGRLVLERAEILTMVKTFIRKVNNDKRLDDNLNRAIDNLCSLGLLGRNKSSKDVKDTALERIEVRRIIGVIVTPEILKQADETLAAYVKNIREGGRSKNKLSGDLDNLALDGDDAAE